MSERFPKSEFTPSAVPNKPGVYIYRDRFGKVIYVGKAANLRRRMSSYFQESKIRTADPKLRSLLNSIGYWEFHPVKNEEESLILESQLIKSYAPHYNILMRDDKRYLLLKINLHEDFPTFVPARVKKNDNCQYFGPFPNGSALRSTLEFLLRYFKLRQCPDANPSPESRQRCLKRIIKDCCAPCTGEISVGEYHEKIDAMLKVLAGDIAPLLAEQQNLMTQYAEKCDFEHAARTRDVIANLQAVFGKRVRAFEGGVIPASPTGMAAADDLQQHLQLPHQLRRIECFDISNILGKLAVGSMVCALDGRPRPDQYRRFRIKTVFQSDDFAMMQEVFTRHYGRKLAENRPMPDLVVVDGGKGQLSSAIEALVASGIPPLPIIGLAKREEEIFIPGREESLKLDRHSPGLRLLQALRDEAHRFAITYHRALRNRLITESILDEIPGVGEKRKQQLLRTFGSIRALRHSNAGEISQRVPGIGFETAQKICEKLQGITSGKTPNNL
ncbi:MAG: excinuclease ABC subunit UvrC [Victivallaceae bacterium]